MTFEEYCDTYHITLNEQQKEAVMRDSGETLLLAVPGSGKTTVIIARIGYLIFCKGIDPSSIMMITYSKAAALEMEERFRVKFGEEVEKPKFATINSMCVTIINYAKTAVGFAVPHLEPDTNKVIRSVLYDATDVWVSDSCVKRLSLQLTTVKNRMLDNDEIRGIKCMELSRECHNLSFAKFYTMYQEFQKRRNIMDFDDQLLNAYNALIDYDQVRHHFQKTYPHIAVDESQDTSMVQYEIIRLLALSGKSLFVVGDDDQSIYGFRGADPSNILNFASYFPEATVLYMETNYRSSEDIVIAAGEFIKQNKARYEKHAVAANKSPGIIKTATCETEKGVYQRVLNYVKEDISKNSTVAVISRNNFTLLPLVELFNQKKISVRRRDNFESLFLHPTLSTITSILRLAVEPWNIQAFRGSKSGLKLYISNSIMRDISKAYETLEIPETKKDILKIAINVCSQFDYIVNAINQIKPILSRIAINDTENAIRLILKHFSSNIEGVEQYQQANLSTTSLYLGTYLNLAQYYHDISTFLEKVDQYTISNVDTRNIDSNITLTTIHSAKGLEFDHVIMIDAIEGIIPQEPNEMDPLTDTEEDARLFYVAVTRAKQRVDFIIPKYYFGTPVSPSSFINHLDKKTIGPPKAPRNKYSSTSSGFIVGDRVFHAKFGEGVVQAVLGKALEIMFDVSGKKKIMSAYVTKWEEE